MEIDQKELLAELIRPSLGPDDDFAFWSQAIDVLASDVESEIEGKKSKHDVYMNVGACSHWLGPHQTRWTAAGGFAWPVGYSGRGYFFKGLPQFDWSVKFLWDIDSKDWVLTQRFKSKRTLVFRAALPSRTMRHNQAAIHTLWVPGPPSDPTEKRLRFYGFRKRQEGEWTCVASKDI